MKIDLDQHQLMMLLKREGIEPHFEEETKQAVFGFEANEEKFPIFVKIFEPSQLVQILVFLPVKIEKGRENETARLLIWLNQTLDLPGFGMEEESQTIFYRIMLPVLGMQIDEGLLSPFLTATRVVATTFLEPIRKVSSGASSFDQVRKGALA